MRPHCCSYVLGSKFGTLMVLSQITRPPIFFYKLGPILCPRTLCCSVQTALASAAKVTDLGDASHALSVCFFSDSAWGVVNINHSTSIARATSMSQHRPSQQRRATERKQRARVFQAPEDYRPTGHANWVRLSWTCLSRSSVARWDQGAWISSLWGSEPSLRYESREL